MRYSALQRRGTVVSDRLRTHGEAFVESVIEIRRRRDGGLGGDLFSDPAWDILLELFAAHYAHRKTSLSDLNSIAPRSTIARWLEALEQKNLITCQVCTSNADQFRIELTADGIAKMTALFTGERIALPLV